MAARRASYLLHQGGVVALCRTQWHAQVPVTVVNVMLVYCHPCQAFSISAHRHTQYDEDELQTDWSTEEHLGPFDGADFAERQAVAYLAEMLRGSGLPWDRSGW